MDAQPGHPILPPLTAAVDGQQEDTRRGGMALPGHPRSSLLFHLFFFVSSIAIAAGGLLGVDYGRDADNLIPPEKVVQLLKDKGIGAVSIYDTDARVLRAFANSGIKVVVSLPNDKLAAAATNPDFAGTWVWENVETYYPETNIIAVKVGNEVFLQRPDLTSSIVPAMQNVYNGLANLGRADAIKVSSPVAFNALDVSFPPSKGSFRRDLQPVLRQMLDFVSRTGSPFLVNIYPFFTYRDNYPNINLDYALGRPNGGVWDPNSGKTYYNLLDAQRDSVYSAMAALGFGATANGTSNSDTGAMGVNQLRATTSPWQPESGWPHRGRRLTLKPDAAPGGRRAALERSTAGSIWNASLAQEPGASVENAQAYNNILVQRILTGNTGTPLHPEADMSVFIFSLFNENLKPGPDSERNFGLFYPDGTPVYDVQWRLPGGDSWCVADPAVGRERMQAALDWACGPGAADCGPIQPGGRCFEPNTVEAHASFAMNSYYQKHNRGTGTCDFSGVGRVVHQRPSFGNCDFGLHVDQISRMDI